MESWRDNKAAFAILTLPGAAWLVAFFTLPMLIIWVIGFGERGPYGQTLLSFSLANYERALDWLYLGIIWKSVKIAALTTLICVVAGFPLTMGIAFAPRRWRMALLVLVILPFWTNLLVRTYAWIAVLRSRGHLNGALEWGHERLNAVAVALGVAPPLGEFQPLELLYNQPAVVIGLVHVHLPFLVLPLYAAMARLDKRTLEASLDLGAGHWRTLRSVLVPLVMPGLVTGALLVFILSLGSFVTPNLLGGTDSLMIGSLIAREFTAARDWPFGAALSFLLVAATFVALWLRAALAARRA